MLLGEASSKCDHIAGVPLAPEVAAALLRLYLAKGVLATTAIEGNTLSEKEAVDFLAGKLSLPPSREYLGKELENIRNGYNELLRDLHRHGDTKLTVEKICWMNKQVLDGLSLAEGVMPGEIRQYNVGVGNYRGAPAEDCRYLMEKFCEVINDFPSLPGDNYITGIIKAVFAHLYFVWIHPFGDGNGRTARLLELDILAFHGLPQPTTHLLSNHYNITRTEYYRHLDLARDPNGGLTEFFKYAVAGFVDGQIEQLSRIRAHQWEVAWTNFIHDKFKDKNSQADVRRRKLILALSEREGFTLRAKLSSLNVELATLYSTKTVKSITRDVNHLIGMGLIERKAGEGVRATKEQILAFLPWRHRDVNQAH